MWSIRIVSLHLTNALRSLTSSWMRLKRPIRHWLATTTWLDLLQFCQESPLKLSNPCFKMFNQLKIIWLGNSNCLLIDLDSPIHKWRLCQPIKTCLLIQRTWFRILKRRGSLRIALRCMIQAKISKTQRCRKCSRSKQLWDNIFMGLILQKMEQAFKDFNHHRSHRRLRYHKRVKISFSKTISQRAKTNQTGIILFKKRDPRDFNQPKNLRSNLRK